MQTPTSAPRVLVIGLDPHRLPGHSDPKPLDDAIKAVTARFADHGIDLGDGMFGLDDDIDAILGRALRAHAWDCVVIGAGVRASEDRLELFEQVINLVRRHAPDAAIAFNSSPSDTFDAVARWVGIPGWTAAEKPKA